MYDMLQTRQAIITLSQPFEDFLVDEGYRSSFFPKVEDRVNASFRDQFVNTGKAVGGYFLFLSNAYKCISLGN